MSRPAESRLLAYMTGWRKGAGSGGATEENWKDPDFMAGWEAGRAAARAEYDRACERYGAELNVLRLQEGETTA